MTLNALMETINADNLTVRVPVSNNLIAQIGVRVRCSSEVDELSTLYGEHIVKRVDTVPGGLLVELK